MDYRGPTFPNRPAGAASSPPGPAIPFLSFLLLLCLLGGVLSPTAGQTGGGFSLKLGGYLKELGQVSAGNDFSEWRYDNILHHRLESRWTFSPDLEFRADLRTRMLNGWSVRNRPELETIYENDPNYADLSTVWLSGGETLLHSTIDRMHLSWYSGPFELHAGRQRVNWGRTFVWNPNDLFNNFAFLDFDYEERPGVDALAAQYNWSYASGLEAAWSPGHTYGGTVMAGMLRESLGSYDVQLIAGYYRRQLVIGGGWAGYAGETGFKGEISWFHSEDRLLESAGHLTATAGIDYMLPSGIYLQGELLYNGGYQRSGAPLAELVRPPSADNLFVARTGWFGNASYQLHPLLSSNLGVMGSFDRSILIIIPQLTYSLSSNFDLLLLSQLLKGGVLRERVETPNLFFFRLRFSY